jgi:hypothetical protein
MSTCRDFRRQANWWVRLPKTEHSSAVVLPLPSLVRRLHAMPHPASPLAAAKERARRVHKEAREGDGRSAALLDRWLADTLSAAAGKPEEVAAATFTRWRSWWTCAAGRRPSSGA